MPKIEMLASVSCRSLFEYAMGQIVEVDEYWAERLVGRGVAKRLPDPEAANVLNRKFVKPRKQK